MYTLFLLIFFYYIKQTKEKQLRMKLFFILFKKLSIDQVQLLPFHQFGENKYKLLKRSYEMENVQALHPEDLYDYQQVFLDYEINCYF